MQYVSSSPSKIPYVGFSPVRLQTGIQPRPSSVRTWFKHEACMRHTLTDLYAAKVLRLCSYGLFPGMLCGDDYIKDYPVQRPLARLWVMLSHRVFAYYGLIRDSRPSRCLIYFVQRVFALWPHFGWHRELPQFTLHIFSTVPSSVPRRSWRLHLTVPYTASIGFRLLRKGSAHASRARWFSQWECNEAAKFALCYGPVDCLPFSSKGFYFQACTS